MKFIIGALLFVSFCYPQEVNSPAVEIFIGTEEVEPSFKNITFNFRAQSPVFGDHINGIDFYYLTNKYLYLSYTPAFNNDDISDWAGWDFVFSQTQPPTYDIFGFGFYNLTVDDSESYF